MQTNAMGQTQVANAYPASDAAPSANVNALPDPLAAPFTGNDALGQLLAALQHMSDTSLSLATTRIEGVQGDAQQQVQDFLKKVADAAEKLRQAHEHHGGFFSNLLHSLANAFGEILGTLSDAALDLAKLPLETTISVVEHFGDSRAMMAAIEQNCMSVFQNGSTADAVKGFTSGVVNFAADSAAFLAKVGVDTSAAALSGKNVGDAAKNAARDLWQSFKSNILDNPQFWKVASVIAKGVAIAAAVMSGGALAPVAVGLMIVLEADNQFGFIDKLVGKGNAPWVRLGLEVAAGACMGFVASAGQGGQALTYLQMSSGLVQAGGSIYAGYRGIVDSAAQARDLEQQAGIQDSMTRAAELQRLLGNLLSSLDSDDKDHEKTRALGASLVGTLQATELAAVVH